MLAKTWWYGSISHNATWNSISCSFTSCLISWYELQKYLFDFTPFTLKKYCQCIFKIRWCYSDMYSKSKADYSYIKVCRYCKIYVGKVPHTPIDFSSPSSGHLVTLFILIRNTKLCRCIIHLRSPVCFSSTCVCSFRVGTPILWDLGLNWATLGCDSLPGVLASLDELGTHTFFEVLRTFRHLSLSTAGTVEQIRW